MLGVMLILFDSLIVIVAFLKLRLLARPRVGLINLHVGRRLSTSRQPVSFLLAPRSVPREESRSRFSVRHVSCSSLDTSNHWGTTSNIQEWGRCRYMAVIWHMRSSHHRQHYQTSGSDLIDVEWQRIEGDNLEKGSVRKNREARFYEERVSANR
ncbi:hypothetical protein CTAM01_03935 [Colletotrichum tamarilloi]|uniref:Uncharacterized protein n=1 Tax=Colletotrichum tamarilloi TaxID=1209934 RepID=A0ABQ9RIZ2_9PEZI|nr:uncharacterized protein CTAM01_03935 [Colletotrichum tamarilloi]KAK1504628.1 hypothetical protein CTAM01_03935 [Colletotrichum tamarilloi]